MNRILLTVALALAPMLLALLGVAIDEHNHLGYSAWVSACRASGPTLTSLVTFTFELLPTGVVGMLTGGLLVQLVGVRFRHHPGGAACALAAHGGCVFGMAGGLLLCTLTLPLPLMLGAESLLAALAAAWLYRAIHEPVPDESVKPRTTATASAQ